MSFLAHRDLPDLSDALRMIDQLPAEAHAAVAHNLIEAVYTYASSGKTEELERFADHVLASLELHRNPEYHKVFLDAPNRPEGTLRSVDEVFARLG
jgi:precorrin-3B methylase